MTIAGNKNTAKNPSWHRNTVTKFVAPGPEVAIATPVFPQERAKHLPYVLLPVRDVLKLDESDNQAELINRQVCSTRVPKNDLDPFSDQTFPYICALSVHFSSFLSFSISIQHLSALVTK
jgi:hypothetical protein